MRVTSRSITVLKSKGNNSLLLHTLFWAVLTKQTVSTKSKNPNHRPKNYYSSLFFRTPRNNIRSKTLYHWYSRTVHLESLSVTSRLPLCIPYLFIYKGQGGGEEEVECILPCPGQKREDKNMLCDLDCQLNFVTKFCGTFFPNGKIVWYWNTATRSVGAVSIQRPASLSANSKIHTFESRESHFWATAESSMASEMTISVSTNGTVNHSERFFRLNKNWFCNLNSWVFFTLWPRQKYSNTY